VNKSSTNKRALITSQFAANLARMPRKLVWMAVEEEEAAVVEEVALVTEMEAEVVEEAVFVTHSRKVVAIVEVHADSPTRVVEVEEDVAAAVDSVEETVAVVEEVVTEMVVVVAEEEVSAMLSKRAVVTVEVHADSVTIKWRFNYHSLLFLLFVKLIDRIFKFQCLATKKEEHNVYYSAERKRDRSIIVKLHIV